MQFLKLPAVFLSLAIAACGGTAKSTPATTPAPRSATVDSNDPSCPVAVPGTSVTVEDASSGAALVFVTTGDVGAVRQRANAMASMHNDHHSSMGSLPDGKVGGHDMSGHAGHDMSGHAGHDMSGHAGHDMSGHAGHDMKGGEHAGHAGGMIGVHSKAEVSDIDGGAKISFIANGADVAKLQSELRMHARHLSAGTCGMSRS
ncbi:MAG: hypothetical protein SFX73_17640 [Kofleriaceae bacterium]|nr:hypothetical protein [Kofleriaceae bacterium]